MSRMKCRVCGKEYGGIESTYDHERIEDGDTIIESWTALYICDEHGRLEVFVEETSYVEDDGEIFSTIEVQGTLFTEVNADDAQAIEDAIKLDQDRNAPDWEGDDEGGER